MARRLEDRARIAYEQAIGLHLPLPTAAQRSKAISDRRAREHEASCIRETGEDPASLSGSERRAAALRGATIKRVRREVKAAAVKGLHARRIREAMPAWADREAIAAVYAEAARLTRETGVPHEVDHIEPLLGANASGLHVHYNLRVITRTENRRKSNRRIQVAPAA